MIWVLKSYACYSRFGLFSENQLFQIFSRFFGGMPVYWTSRRAALYLVFFLGVNDSFTALLGGIYSSLGAIIRAIYQQCPIALFAVIPALPAKRVIANPSSIVQKQRPFLFELFRHSRHNINLFSAKIKQHDRLHNLSCCKQKMRSGGTHYRYSIF